MSYMQLMLTGVADPADRRIVLWSFEHRFWRRRQSLLAPVDDVTGTSVNGRRL